MKKSITILIMVFAFIITCGISQVKAQEKHANPTNATLKTEQEKVKTTRNSELNHQKRIASIPSRESVNEAGQSEVINRQQIDNSPLDATLSSEKPDDLRKIENAKLELKKSNPEEYERIYLSESKSDEKNFPIPQFTEEQFRDAQIRREEFNNSNNGGTKQ